MMKLCLRSIGAALLLAGSAQLAFAQVMMSEIDPATGTIELHNAGDAEVDVSTMYFCNRPAYVALSELEVVSGEMMIPAGGFLVITWDAVAAADAELGLYSEPSYSNASALVDYVAWGSAGHGREGVAVEAGLWPEGAFVMPPGEGQSLAHVGDGSDAVADWVAGAPSLGEANTAE